MLKKIIKFFSVTESNKNWETPGEYTLRVFIAISCIVVILALVCSAIFH